MADATSTLNVVISAKDAATPVLNSLSSRLNSIGTQVKQSVLTGFGLGAGISAFGGLQRAVQDATSFLKDSVTAAIDDEESISRLGASLRANIPAWDGNTAAIERRLKAGVALGFTDDEQRNALTGLVAATHDATKAQDVMSVAMDLARFKHISLQEASDALVKVEAGRYRILASLGIVLKKGATATEALAAVEKVAAGSAQAFGDTTQGAMTEASVAIHEAQEQIGKVLLPILKQVAFFVRDVVAPNLGILGIALAGVATVILVSVVPAIVAATVAAAPWLLALGAIAGAAYVITQAFQAPGGANSAMSHWGGVVKDSTKVMNDSLNQGFSDMPVIVDRGVQAAHQHLADGFHAIEQDATATGTAIPTNIADGMLAAQQVLADPIGQLNKFIKDALSPMQVIARDQTFLASKAMQDAITSSNPLVAQKALEMKNAMLAELGGLASAGYSIGSNWIQSIIAAIRAGKVDMITAVTTIRNLMGHSLPKEGPLEGKGVIRAGLSVGRAYAGAISAGINGTSMAMSLPAMGMASSGGGGFGGGGYAPAGPINVQVDGRNLFTLIDQRLYVAVAATGGGYRPR